MNLVYKIKGFSLFLQNFIRYERYILFLSESTCLEIVQDIKTFLNFIKIKTKKESDKITISYINFVFLNFPSLTKDYIYYLKNTLDNSSDTISRKIYSLKKLLSYLYERNELSFDFAKKIEYNKPHGKKLIKHLSLNDTKRYLKISLNKSCKMIDLKLRNYCICNFFLNLGIRVNELVSIKLSDISISEKTIVIHGKGSKDRVLYLNPSALEALKKYLKIRPVLEKNNFYHDFLFISKKNKALSKRQVQYITKNIFNLMGKEDYSTHKLRSTYINLLYNNICNLGLKPKIYEFATILGHNSLKSINRYLDFNMNNVEKMFKNFDILNLTKKRKEGRQAQCII